MWPESSLLRLYLLRSIKYRPVQVQKCSAHYQITSSGEKVVVSKRHNIKTKREKWQQISPMGHEPELRTINRIEKDERLQADPLMAKVTAESKLEQLRSRLQISGYVVQFCF